MISKKVKIKIHNMNYSKLSDLTQWLVHRYWQKDTPELAHYIIAYHYHLEEGRAGLL